MIVELNVQDKQTASEMLHVQIPAYEVEAALIQFDGIPQLGDTVETLGKSEETFLGWMSDEELVGFLSYTIEEECYVICRMVVHPKQMRKGIATRLLTYFLNHVCSGKRVEVSTGAANVPAKNLYGKFGFEEIEDIQVVPGVWLSTMVKKE